MAVVCPTAAQLSPHTLPPLPVVRLDGPAGGRAGAPAVQGPPPARPGVMPVTQLDDPARAALDGAPSVSLSISQPMPLPELLRLLVSGTPLSLVIDEQVTGTFEGDLKALTMRQALEAVLFPRVLDYDLRGSLIRVFPRRPATRLFDVNQLNLRRTSRRGVRADVSVPAGAPAADVQTAATSDPLTELAAGVQALLSSSGRMHLDRGAGLVQVTDFADRLDQVGIYVEAVQVRASRQVRLDAMLFEITLHDAAAGTIDWAMAVSRAGGAVRQARGAAGLRIGDWPAFMRAIAEQGSVRTIAAPKILAMNNEPAVLRVGTEAVYFAAASDAGPGAAAAVLDGFTLTLTAQIAVDGIVQLHVAPSYAAKTGEARGARAASAPVLSVAEADTTVRLGDGETVAISGLLREGMRTRPGTGFAGLFGAQTREAVKSELVILLTPSVVVPGVATVAGAR